MEQNENDKKTKPRTFLMTMTGEPPVGDNTTIMLYMVSQAVLVQHRPVAYFSTRMTDVEVVNRLLAINTGIDLQKISDGTLTTDEWQRLDAVMPKLLTAPLYIDDTREMTLNQLDNKIIDLVEKKDVCIVVVDPVRDLATGSYNPVEESDRLDFITCYLRQIAEERGVVIFSVE